ncbi:MAG: PqqD family protein [Myxococcota bacterium]|jgi:hypothetical protein|nr:PqqD family protein [Myxococcota bacterium]
MFAHLALSENGFLFDQRTGYSFSLSRTGVFLLRRLLDGTPPEQLAAALRETFEVDEQTAERDAIQFLSRLKDLRLTEEEDR